MVIHLSERKPDLIRPPDVEVIFGGSWRRLSISGKLPTKSQVRQPTLRWFGPSKFSEFLQKIESKTHQITLEIVSGTKITQFCYTYAAIARTTPSELGGSFVLWFSETFIMILEHYRLSWVSPQLVTPKVCEYWNFLENRKMKLSPSS